MGFDESIKAIEGILADAMGSARAAEAERWKRYVDLLRKELEETVSIAYVHGWRSTRFEEGKLLRAELGIRES